MSDQLVRAITKDGFVKAVAVSTRDLTERARQIHHTLPVATAALGRTLAAASMMGNALKGDGASVTLQIKDPSLKVISRQKTLPMPTNLTRQLHREACAILDAAWPADATIRLMTVTAGSLCGEDEAVPAQLSFLTEVAPDDPRRAAVERAVDQVRARFGHSAVTPGTPEIK